MNRLCYQEAVIIYTKGEKEKKNVNKASLLNIVKMLLTNSSIKISRSYSHTLEPRLSADAALSWPPKIPPKICYPRKPFLFSLSYFSV